MVNTWPQVDRYPMVRSLSSAVLFINTYPSDSDLLAGQRYPLLIYQNFATAVLNPLTPKSD